MAANADAIFAFLGRDLADGPEKIQANLLWDMARRRIVALHSAAETNPVLPDVLGAIVVRLLKNPDAFKSETDGNYAYSRLGDDPSLLLPNAQEWRLLGMGRSGAFTVDPTPTGAGPRPAWYGEDRWR